jgi:glycogen operon protein
MLLEFYFRSRVQENLYSTQRRHAATEDPIEEFRQMVRELHTAGIEVIIDVVYNHTSESSEEFPPQSLRGLDNEGYYQMHDGHYCDSTGCGNTLDTNKPAARKLILDSLHYWHEIMGIDGFRFDRYRMHACLERPEDG